MSDDESETEAGPGPCDYASEVISPVASKQEEFQFFGTSTLRFKSDKRKASEPGPGAYNQESNVPKLASKGSSFFLKERSIDKIFPPSIGPGPVPYSKQHVYVPKINKTGIFITNDS